MQAELLTTKEMAGKLRISLRTLYALLESGKIGAVRVGEGGKVLFREEDLNEILQPYETRKRSK